MSGQSSVLGGLKQPEYTGSNRCLPCTVVNLLVAGAIAALAWTISAPLAAGVLAVSVLTIYFRGYLVPGTPTLTKRYLPESVLTAFHGSTVEDELDDDGWEAIEKRKRERERAVDPETFLLEADAVEERANDLALTDSFRDRVWDHVEAFEETGVDDETLASLFDTEPDAIERLDRDYPAIKIDVRIRQWPSEGAYYADLATHRALEATTEQWRDVPLEQRLDILKALRSFLERCPLCGGTVTPGERTVESCCTSGEVVSFACVDCDERLLEIPAESDVLG